MAATTDEKPVVDDFSDAEKDDAKVHDKLAGLEDPDAGLSEEERAKIVCVPCASRRRDQSSSMAGRALTWTLCLGPQTPLET